MATQTSVRLSRIELGALVQTTSTTSLPLDEDIAPAIEDVEPLSVQDVHVAFTTSSNMTVHNDSLGPVAVDIPNSQAMKDNGDFPKETIQPNQSDSHQVTVSFWDPRQSWFDVTFNGGYKIHTLLGSAQNSTSASPLYFDDGKVAVMVSPKVISPAVSRFDLDYFVGPGTIPLLVNSFVQANLPAIIDHINTKGILKTWRNGLSIGLTNIGMNPTDLMCSYSGMSNVTATSADVNVIVRLNNKTSFTGSFKSGNTDVASLTVSLNNLALMLRVHADLSSKTVQVTNLKMSLDDYSIPATFWLLLAIINPSVAAILKLASINANTFAMAVNNNPANEKIIDAINDAIKGIIPTDLAVGAPLILANPDPTSSSYATAASIQDFSSWMSSDAMQGKTLQSVHLPGSHDSGAYDLSSVLPRTSYAGGKGIKYDDIKFLWTLKPDTAPSNGDWPFGAVSEQSPLDLGSGLYQFVLDTVVRGISQAGDQNLTQQLKGGIRWFDLRIYHDDDGNFYLQHGLRGPSYNEVLDQIKAYLDTYPSSRELIFLNLSHADFDSNIAQQVAQLTTSIIPSDHLLHFPNDQGSDTFDFQSLASRSVSSLTNGSTKIILLNSDAGIRYPAPITNSSGFAGSDQPLWNFNWCRTPDVVDIVPYILGILQGRTGKHLQALATEKNGQLEQALQDAKTRTANVVAVDWFQLSLGKLPVPQIVALND